MSELFWSVDSLVIKGNVLFGFGWIFHANQEIVSLRFKISTDSDRNPEYIYADWGKSREDVEKLHPHTRAANSGYVVFGALSQATPCHQVNLECALENGNTIELCVPSSRIIRFTENTARNDKRLVLRQASTLVLRGIQLIQSGKFISLFEKIKRYLSGRPKSVLQQPDELVSLLQQHKNSELSLILDHDLGGGANQYRDRLVDSLIADDHGVIILTYHVTTLSYMIIFRNKKLHQRFAIPNVFFLLEACLHLHINNIIYNTAVSFVKPQEIPQLLIQLKVLNHARLSILVHDFYLVCPSHFLLNHHGKYCHIPDSQICNQCLPKNRYGFATLFTEKDIAKWRAIWGSVLTIADEIVTFSNSTAKLLIKAYPQIESSQIIVKPHQVQYIPETTISIGQTATLRIGVVGQIGFHKGAAFIQQLSKEIMRRGLDIAIVVIGSIELSCESSIVRQTGPYQHDQLPELIHSSGTNIMLFPSIWPETFSYVAQELIQMNLPVASFNFGAPAERIATYSKGLILSTMDAAKVLDELINFHHKIYLANND